MLGGMTQDHAVSDDGFCFVHGSRMWMRLVWQPGQAPSGLWNHSASLVHDKIIVVVGGKTHKLCSSVRLFDLASGAWLHVPVATDVFAPRTLHAAVTVGSTVLIHGGCVSNGSCSDELFSFDVASCCVKRLAPAGRRPGGRCRHSLNLVVSAYGDAHVVCFGGSNDGDTLDDLWVLDCSSMSWSRVDVVGERVSLEGHTAAAVGNRCILFVGGYSRSKSNPSQLDWPGTGVLVYDFSTKVMSRCSSVGDFPRKLIGHAASQCGRSLVVFGGMMPDGSGDTSGTYVSSDAVAECDRITSSMHSSRADSASNVRTRPLSARSPASASSFDGEDSESESESKSSCEMSEDIVSKPGNLLSQAGSVGDLVHIEQELLNTLKTISALREDGLLHMIDSKCDAYSSARESGDGEAAAACAWVDGILTQAAAKPDDVRQHIVFALIKRTSACGLMNDMLKQLCCSFLCAPVAAAAVMMSRLWSHAQRSDFMTRIRRMCASDAGCFDFVAQSHHCMRFICSVLPEGHPLHQDSLVCQHLVATALGSLNVQSLAPQLPDPLNAAFFADIRRVTAEVCRLIPSFSQRIVLRTPACVAQEHVHRVLGSCGCKALQPSAVLAITQHLAQAEPWECHVSLPFSILHLASTSSHVWVAGELGARARRGAPLPPCSCMRLLPRPRFAGLCVARAACAARMSRHASSRAACSCHSASMTC
jgi:hypothetical protein